MFFWIMRRLLGIPARRWNRTRHSHQRIIPRSSKYHQGLYKVKNPEKYRGDLDNVFFRSDWERKAFVYCDRSKKVKYWASEEINVRYFMKGEKKPYRYVPDLMIYFEDSRVVMVEIKPKEEQQKPSVQNQCKWAAARQYCKKRGWKFQVWTEDTIDKFW